ncbi:hypothetical protein B0H13DRAFT_1875611 [Mycena leptocephala]|nr:hypothetical protein B0H13DRAFT_1875611 [Mycena leptocephala]
MWVGWYTDEDDVRVGWSAVKEPDKVSVYKHDGARESVTKQHLGWARGWQMRVAASGRDNVNAAASTTLSRHEGVIAQSVFHNPIMPSDGMDTTTSAAGSRLATT